MRVEFVPIVLGQVLPEDQERLEEVGVPHKSLVPPLERATSEPVLVGDNVGPGTSKTARNVPPAPGCMEETSRFEILAHPTARVLDALRLRLTQVGPPRVGAVVELAILGVNGVK